jgi:branched-chain amino acid transport system ATP-binding protein
MNEAVALLGTNGAGKTTLLNAVSRLHRRIDGSISFLGREISRLRTSDVAKIGLSYSRERAPVVTRMTVEENIQLAEALAGRRRREPLGRDALWEYFPVLRARRKQTAGLLSGGQRQMLSLACAFVSRPTFLLLDEPSAGLAPTVAGPVSEAIGWLCTEGVGLLLAEQNVEWVQGMATRAYMLENGRVVATGEVAEFV